MNDWWLCRSCPTPIPTPAATRVEINQLTRDGISIPPHMQLHAFGFCSPECESAYDLAKRVKGVIS